VGRVVLKLLDAPVGRFAPYRSTRRVITSLSGIHDRLVITRWLDRWKPAEGRLTGASSSLRAPPWLRGSVLNPLTP